MLLFFLFFFFFSQIAGIHIILRSTEGAIRGRQYGPFMLLQPEKRSFEGSINGFGPRTAPEVLLGFTI